MLQATTRGYSSEQTRPHIYIVYKSIEVKFRSYFDPRHDCKHAECSFWQPFQNNLRVKLQSKNTKLNALLLDMASSADHHLSTSSSSSSCVSSPHQVANNNPYQAALRRKVRHTLLLREAERETEKGGRLVPSQRGPWKLPLSIGDLVGCPPRNSAQKLRRP